MPQLKMTDKAVQAVTVPHGERVDFFDSHPRDRQPGLVLRVNAQPDGAITRTWSVVYRIKGHPKLRRATVGQYPGYTLAQARAEAADVVHAARRGVDLVAQREAAARAQLAKEKDTLESVVPMFLKAWTERPKKKGGRRSEAYLDHTQRYFDLHVLPRWRGRHLAEITRTDVDELVTEISRGGVINAKGERTPGGPTTANRTLAAVKALLNWCVRTERLPASPATLVERPGIEQQRERVLTAEDLRAVWPAFVAAGYPFGSAFRMLALTGQRLSEVSGMRWSEVDEETKLWTLAAARTKAHRAHAVPLSAEALTVLADCKAHRLADAEGDYVFTTNGRAPISGWSRAKLNVDTLVAKARKEAELKPLAPWRLHDLRRTAATEMSRLGVARFTVARILNHVDAAITGVYDRGEHLAEKTAALQLWGRHLIGIIENKPATVTSISEGRRRKASKTK